MVQVEARQLGNQHLLCPQRLVGVGVLEQVVEGGEVLARREVGVPVQEAQEVQMLAQVKRVDGEARRHHGVVAVRVPQIAPARRRLGRLGGEITRLLAGGAQLSSRVAGMYRLAL